MKKYIRYFIPPIFNIIKRKVMTYFSALSYERDPEKYWKKRHATYLSDSLKGVGNSSLSERENNAVYKGAQIIFKHILNDIALPDDAIIFEYGFGTGFYTNIIHSAGKFLYHGFDITDTLIGEITTKHPEYVGKLFKCNVGQETVHLLGKKDLIYMIDVTQHMVNTKELTFCLRENVQNQLKHGGVFIVTDELTNTKYDFYERSRTLDFYQSILSKCTLYHHPIWFRDKYIFSFKKVKE